MRIGEICNRHTVVLPGDASVIEAARTMRLEHVGSVVVVQTESDRRPMGVLTDRDIVVELLAEAIDLEALAVKDVMAFNLVTAHSDDDLSEAISIMGTAGLRRLPVVDDKGELVGLLSADDALRHMAGDLSSLADLVSREISHERARRSRA